MLTGLDGVLIAVNDLALGVRDFERLLGIAPRPVTTRGSSEPAFLFDLGNTMLELRALEPATPSRPSEGIAGLRFAFRPGPDSRFAAGRVEGSSVPVELVTPGERAQGEVEAATSTPGGPRRPDAAGNDDRGGARHGVLGLDHVVVATREAERARRFFGDDLGLRLALDRRFPERGLRLLFFRVGGLTIEVASTLAGARSDSPTDSPTDATADGAADPADAFHGLALKVEGIEAVHARVAASGFEVSAVRGGFKPGTRVFGTRTAVHGVPILWIEHPPRPGW
jgi:catechol 2,3-dioxygenase-like lactoylglutathione lyase family enzyme